MNALNQALFIVNLLLILLNGRELIASRQFLRRLRASIEEIDQASLILAQAAPPEAPQILDAGETPRTDRETYTITARDIGFKAVSPQLCKLLEAESRRADPKPGFPPNEKIGG